MSLRNAFMFASGESVYSAYDRLYTRHRKGLIVLGPPGIGKTYYCNYVQKQGSDGKRDWIDADEICSDLNVQWHLNEEVDTKLNYLRAEYILEQSRALGYRVIGSLFWGNILPDAIVVPDLEVHKSYSRRRPDLVFEDVLRIRRLLKEMASKQNIKVFTTIEAAVRHTEEQHNK